MAASANTQQVYSSIGVREDLENNVYKVTANRTPFTNMIGDAPVTQPFHEWQTYTQRAPAANANEAGDDTTATAAEQTVRVGNRTQIFKEAGSVARTTRQTTFAGRADAKAWQVAQKSEILATDMELAFFANQASVIAASGTPPRAAGALAWISSNFSRGAGGASGGYNTGTGLVAAATNGTQRAITETLLKSVLASGYSNGANNLSTVFCSAAQKQAISAFTGIALSRAEVKGKNQVTLYGGVDVYVSDFGPLNILPVQYGLTRDVLIVDPDMWSVGTLSAMKVEDLAKTGDSDRFHIVAEKTLICRNQRASAVIADLS